MGKEILRFVPFQCDRPVHTSPVEAWAGGRGVGCGSVGESGRGKSDGGTGLPGAVSGGLKNRCRPVRGSAGDTAAAGRGACTRGRGPRRNCAAGPAGTRHVRRCAGVRRGDRAPDGRDRRAARARVTGRLVVLGAGLDTRAWRLPGLAQTTVWEADHAAGAPTTLVRRVGGRGGWMCSGVRSECWGCGG
ncbi:class I SAM-dependent methyltransferase [Streptomyces sp. LN704]|uniref:class I SAM-dependent methyltransferase n=1 Tax=unclassified Streptomyces TaxID=2593676 RepID=UPI00371C4F62